jgi:beta-methylarginine biosynthesis bifunctional aminotransferase
MSHISPQTAAVSVLEQRLRRVAGAPHRDWTNILETVPCWPDLPKIPPTAFSDLGGYAPCAGTDGLIARVIRRERRVHGVRLEPEEVLITNGALHGIALTLTSHSKRGIALCQAPTLASVAASFAAAGYEVSYFGSQDGSIDVDAVERACAREVSIVYVNTPHNPTGAVCDERTVRQLVEITARAGTTLIVDMVYDSFSFDTSVTSPLAFTSDRSHVYVVNSMSKNYGAPGLRIGWVLSSAANVARVSSALERECIAVSGVSQRQASVLLDHGNEALVESVHRKLPHLLAELYEVGLTFCHPRGGTAVWVELPVEDVEVFADYVLDRHALVLATASNYAGTSLPCIRIPIGADLGVLIRAIDLLSAALRDYSRTLS